MEKLHETRKNQEMRDEIAKNINSPLTSSVGRLFDAIGSLILSKNTASKEAEIPMAIAQAFREGNLGIMDYYNLRNIQADTNMRKTIAGKDSGEDESIKPKK